MSDLIQWPRAKYWDRAWNPIVGCKPCSPACENCYAKAWAERFGQSFEPHKTKENRPPQKGVVFCGNMTDLFGEWVPQNWLFSNFGPNATYLWLTKRTKDMVECMRSATSYETFDSARRMPAMMPKNGTVQDIAKWMRGLAESLGTKRRVNIQTITVAAWIELCQALEEAARRDNKKARDAIYAEAKRNAERESVGNSAKLRDVCEQFLELLEAPAGFEDCGMGIELNEEQVVIWRNRFSDALAAQQRNCDVGSAEEQKERFEKFCEAQPTANCDGCHLAMNYSCEFEWAQMPYEATREGGDHADAKTETH